jgi:hypothetical protein
MVQQPRSQLGVVFLGGSEVAADLLGAFAEAEAVLVGQGWVGARDAGELLTLDLPQVLHRHLQDVRLLHLAVARTLAAKRVRKKGISSR